SSASVLHPIFTSYGYSFLHTAPSQHCC